MTLALGNKPGLCETINEHCNLAELVMHQKTASVVLRMVAAVKHQTVAVVAHQMVAAVGKSLLRWGRGTMLTAYFNYVRKMGGNSMSIRWVFCDSVMPSPCR